jgi:glutamine synthetase
MLTWSDLPDRDIDIVRILWPDLHGVARGKDVVVDEIHRVTGDGLGFCQALLLTDLTGLPVSSAITDAGGWSDAVARPDARTLREVPYAPGLAVSLADILDPGTGEAHALSSRAALQRQVDRAQELDLTPIMAPELEFYLCRPDERAEHAWVPYVGRASAGTWWVTPSTRTTSWSGSFGSAAPWAWGSSPATTSSVVDSWRSTTPTARPWTLLIEPSCSVMR